MDILIDINMKQLNILLISKGDSSSLVNPTVYNSID